MILGSRRTSPLRWDCVRLFSTVDEEFSLSTPLVSESSTYALGRCYNVVDSRTISATLRDDDVGTDGLDQGNTYYMILETTLSYLFWVPIEPVDVKTILRPLRLSSMRVYGHVHSNDMNTSFHPLTWFASKPLPTHDNILRLPVSLVGYFVVLIAFSPTDTYATKGLIKGILVRESLIILQETIVFLHDLSWSAYSTQQRNSFPTHISGSYLEPPRTTMLEYIFPL